MTDWIMAGFADAFSQLPAIEILLVASLVVLVAAVIQVSVGMGFGMIASPLIALLDPRLVPVPIMLLGLAVAAYGAWGERGNILVRHMKAGIGGRVIGMSLAIGVLFYVPDRDAFVLVFGILVLIAVIMTASGLQLALNQANLWFMSSVSGFMGTFTSVGAPPMAILFRGQEPSLVRPTLNAFFGFGSALSLFGLFISGWLQASDFLAACVFFPAMVFGLYLSRFFRFSSSLWLGRILLVLSGMAAVLLIFRGLS